MTALLGLDLGTSGVKVAVVSPEGEILALSSAPYGVNAARPGWAETDPEDWWVAVRAAVGEALGTVRVEVAGIGLSGQMHGVVLCGPAGVALRPAILWADTRAGAEALTFSRLPATVRDRLANPVVPGMAGPILLWVARHEPDVLAAATWAFQPKDWVRFRLTGVAHSEPSDASGTLLYDLIGDDWAYGVVEDLGLPGRLLPPLVESGQPAGALTEQAADVLGLPAGLPVAAGAADTAAAAVGTGLLEPGPVQLTVGTGAQLVAPLLAPRPDPNRATNLHRAAAPGHWYAMAAVQNAGLAIEWALRGLNSGWEEAYRALEVVGPGAGGASFLPYLTGERDGPNLTGAWAGLRLHHKREHLLRAVLEGVAFSIRTADENLARAGAGASHFFLAGGGSTNPAWRQLLADVLGRSLQVMPTPSASARGAALLGGVACGFFPDVGATLTVAPAPASTTQPGPMASNYEEPYRHFRSLAAGLGSAPAPDGQPPPVQEAATAPN